MGRCDLALKPCSIPTWLPNWSIPTTYPGEFEINSGMASGYSAAVFEVIENQRLRVCGITVGTLESVARHGIFENSTEALYTVSNFVKEIRRMSQEFQISESQFKAFCETLCSGYFTDNFHPQNRGFILPNILQSIEYLSRVIEADDFNEAPLPAGFESFIDRAAGCLHGRLVYRTSIGTLGIVSNCAEPGDIVVVLLGFNSAMILRPSHDNTHRVVGNSYCNGYMCCESLLGSLPDTHRMVWIDDETESVAFPVYLEIGSNIMQVEDPRLGELPRGWKLVEYAKKHLYHLFVNETTGERTHKDPRLTPEALKVRGVKMEYFDLV